LGLAEKSRIDRWRIAIYLGSRCALSGPSPELIILAYFEMDSEPAHSKKRSRASSSESHDPDFFPNRESQKSDTSKRKRLSREQSAAKYLLVHRVECSQIQRYHQKHRSRADYLNVPALVAGANRSTALHGRNELLDVASYLDDHGYSFAVYLYYDCETYHDEIKDKFKRFPMPSMPYDIATDSKPYFHVLERDGTPALVVSEQINLSESLEEALTILYDQEFGTIKEWNLQEDLIYPYPKLHHCKHLFYASSTGTLDRDQKAGLVALFRYVTERSTSDFNELASLAETGVTNRRHWAMLFRPGDIVTTMEDGHSRAFTVISPPQLDGDALKIACWSWEFDGTFFRYPITLRNEWPSRAKQVAITSLPIYPLRYDTKEVEEKLRARGRIFWSCRNRKYVSYKTPHQEHGPQLVRFTH
jgi:hypothetical protein